MKTLGTYIRTLRLEKNLSSEAMAEYLNVSQGTYSNYETGTSRLIHPNFFKIAEFFGYEPERFLSNALKDEKNRYSPELLNLVTESPAYYGLTVQQLRNELERKTKEIGVLEYRLSKYEPINQDKRGA